jgi:hypothetical protein
MRSPLPSIVLESAVPMLQIQPQPRGFSGRPLLALLFAVGIGIVVRPIASWFMLHEPTVSTIILTTVVLVGYSWYWFDGRQG